MSKYFLWIPVGLLLAVSGGSGAPVKGSHTLPGMRIGAKSHMDFEEMFQGGRRACVIAMGDHKPVVDVGIAVYDDTGRLVAQDQGGGDFVAAIWYPPREAKYKIVVTNPGVEYNLMYLVFK